MTISTLADDLGIQQLSGTNLRDCYQCGKCSAGCPMAETMDVLPNRLIRLVQLGQAEKAMRAGAIWKCVSCMTCTARCPKSVDCAGVMDALRQIAFEHGAAPSRDGGRCCSRRRFSTTSAATAASGNWNSWGPSSCGRSCATAACGP